MNRSLLLFEDAHWADLSPLADVLPVPALAFGASTLAEKWVTAAGDVLSIEVRAHVRASWRDAPATTRPTGGDVLVVNAACVPGSGLETAAATVAEGEEALFTSGGRLVGAVLPLERVRPGLGRGAGFVEFLAGLALEARDIEVRLLARPWQIVAWNVEAMEADLQGVAADQAGDVHPSAVVYVPERVRIGAGARVEAHTVLDAREGPIVLEQDVLVRPGTHVEGPCVVRRGTQLLGGRVARSTLGPDCRIAGEVEESVWQGRSNKRHHGFVGHSFIGEWVNLGALTTTSDLKNNYGSVRVEIGGETLDTGLSKLGALIGAHVKTGIGTLLPTGAVVGLGSNLFGGGRFAPKWVPPFAWWDGQRADVHRIEGFMATARIAMSRRGVKLSAHEEAALRRFFDATRERRGASVSA